MGRRMCPDPTLSGAEAAGELRRFPDLWRRCRCPSLPHRAARSADNVSKDAQHAGLSSSNSNLVTAVRPLGWALQGALGRTYTSRRGRTPHGLGFPSEHVAVSDLGAVGFPAPAPPRGLAAEGAGLSHGGTLRSSFSEAAA